MRWQGRFCAITIIPVTAADLGHDGRFSMIERFLCVGNLNVDITFQLSRMPKEHEKLRCPDSAVTCGGSAANTAYWLARLGAKTQMCGCVGKDPLGDACILDLDRAGVDTRLIQRSAKATGIAAIFVNPAGKRMVTSIGANAALDPARVPADAFQTGVHLHVATAHKPIARSLLLRAKDARMSTSCDLDEAPSPELIPLLDFCFINQSDLHRSFGAIRPHEAWQKMGCGPALVLTCGEEGARLLSKQGECLVPAFLVEAADRTGGGDAFDAGFLYALSIGLDGVSCLRLGLFLAARVISVTGARAGTFDWEEFQALAEGHRGDEQSLHGTQKPGIAVNPSGERFGHV